MRRACAFPGVFRSPEITVAFVLHVCGRYLFGHTSSALRLVSRLAPAPRAGVDLDGAVIFGAQELAAKVFAPEPAEQPP